MRLYIAGPVTGRSDRNSGCFERAAELLESFGYTVSVPTRIVHPSTTHEAAMRMCIAELLRCDGLAVLPGWRHSKGACLEFAVATACGMDAMSAQGWCERGES